MDTIINPIITGFNPDPSICRVEDDYYLVTSTFEFFPGVPVYHSKNLIDWELINYCLNDKSQLPLNGLTRSKGIYAPTIRFHEGTFYMITTNVAGGGNFYVTTNNIKGKWSDPIWIDIPGIDPTLYFDEDGKSYFVGTNKQGIVLAEIDILTGEIINEPQLISEGSGGSFCEAPHIYKKDSYYYLLLAEGGTQEGHMVTIHRSKDLYGPYVGCENNPILTHRNRTRIVTKGTGHGDLFWDQNGNCFMVFLAYRTIHHLHLHNLGRETFLAPVTWVDGWPVVGNDGTIELEMEAELPGILSEIGKSDFEELFQSDDLSLHWSYIRNPMAHCYIVKEGRMYLHSNEYKLSEREKSPCFMGIRQKAFKTVFEVVVEPLEESYGGITAYLTDEHHYDIFVKRDKEETYIGVRKRLFDNEFDLVQLPVTINKAIELKIESDEDYYYFYYRDETGQYILLEKGHVAGLCTEVTTTTTFTGVFLGAFCEKGSLVLHRVGCKDYM